MSVVLTPSQRSLRARLAAYSMHARNDGRTVTANARAAFLGKFLTEVDPEGKLPPAERERRALAARKAYFTRIAYKSVKKRQQKG